MFDSKQDLIHFLENFADMSNPPYKAPYLSVRLINGLEQRIGKALPTSFRSFLLLFNFDNLQLGTTMFGDGSSGYLDYILGNNENTSDYLKIASGEIGGIFISIETGQIWSQFIEGDIINQTKLADNFEAFLTGYAFLQKKRMERNLPLKELAKLITEEIGSEDYKVWLHAIL